VRSRSNAEKAVALLLFILAYLWFVPELQVRYYAQDVSSEDVPSLINEYRRTWARIIGGFFVLLGLYFTWRRVEISQRTLETQQDQQVTERFTRAIEQLGATDDKGKKKLEIRLGGIYTLERIARDSERDHWPIMETLTTYVREHAPRPPKKRLQEDVVLPPPHLTQRQQKASNEPDPPQPEVIPLPEPDIQAILTVLRRRTRHLGKGEAEPLNLHLTYLRKVSLSEAHLEGARLYGANLAGSEPHWSQPSGSSGAHPGATRAGDRRRSYQTAGRFHSTGIVDSGYR